MTRPTMAETIMTLAVGALGEWFPRYIREDEGAWEDEYRVKVVSETADSVTLRAEQQVWPYQDRTFTIRLTVEEAA